jgi:hypothetical protein
VGRASEVALKLHVELQLPPLRLVVGCASGEPNTEGS